MTFVFEMTTKINTPLQDITVKVSEHDNEWCVVLLGLETNKQEDPEEWHYSNLHDAVERFKKEEQKLIDSLYI